MKESKEYKALFLPPDVHYRIKKVALSEKKTMIELLTEWSKNSGKIINKKNLYAQSETTL